MKLRSSDNHYTRKQPTATKVNMKYIITRNTSTIRLTFFLCCKKMFSICGKATWWENFCFQETKDPLKIFDQPRQLWNVIPGTILQSSEWHQPVHKLHDNRYPCFWGCQLINGKLYPWWIELLEASSVCREFVKCNCIKFCTGICIRFKTDLQWTELCYCLGPCPYSKS